MISGRMCTKHTVNIVKIIEKILTCKSKAFLIICRMINILVSVWFAVSNSVFHTFQQAIMGGVCYFNIPSSADYSFKLLNKSVFFFPNFFTQVVQQVCAYTGMVKAMHFKHKNYFDFSFTCIDVKLSTLFCGTAYCMRMSLL